MPLPKIVRVLQPEEGEIKRGLLVGLREDVKQIISQLIRLRNAAFGIEEATRILIDINEQEAKLLGKSLEKYRSLIADEFKEEGKLRAIAARLRRVIERPKEFSIIIEGELAAGTFDMERFKQYIKELANVLAKTRPLVDEFEKIAEFEFSEEQYKSFFERLGYNYAKFSALTKRKLGTLVQQHDQMGLALDASSKLILLLRKFK